DLVAHFLDRFDAVMEKINLSLAVELAVNGVANNAFVVAADDGFDWEPVQRRGLDRRHVFNADQGKIERTRDWSGGERQHIDQLEKLLELFLVENAETLFFVDHDKAEVFKDDVPGDEAVG